MKCHDWNSLKLNTEMLKMLILMKTVNKLAFNLTNKQNLNLVKLF